MDKNALDKELFEACCSETQQWDKAKRLIKQGASPTYEGKNHNDELDTALITMAYQQDLYEMIPSDLDVDYIAGTAVYLGPLNQAASASNLDNICFMIDRGVDITSADNFGKTALDYVEGHRVDIIEVLVLHGLVPGKLDKDDKKDKVIYEVLKQMDKLGNRLEDLVGKDRLDKKAHKLKLLHWLSKYDDVSIVKCTDDKLWSLNWDLLDSYMNTPLHLAILHNRYNNVRFLISHCDVNKRNLAGETPLHLSVKNNNIKISSLLIAGNSDVNIFTKDHQSALHIASTNGRVDIVKLLVDNSADINATTDKDTTPISIAVKARDLDLVKYLVSQGATMDGTILHLALLGNDEMLKYLVTNKCPINEPNENGLYGIHTAVSNLNCSVLKTLLAHECDVDAKDASGNTALHLALMKEDEEMVTLLLGNKPDINIVNTQGDSPLHLCIRRGTDLLKIILAEKPDVDCKDAAGDSALQAATAAQDYAAVSALLAAGADPNLTDRANQTPLDVARDYSVLQILVKYGASTWKIGLKGKDELIGKMLTDKKDGKKIYFIFIKS